VNGRNEGFGHLSSRVNCSPRTAFSQKRRVTLRPKGVEQQDAADEAGASHGASLLILVFYGHRVSSQRACFDYPLEPGTILNHGVSNA